MRLNAPRRGIWIFSLILALASLASHFLHVPYMTGDPSYWVMGAAWLLLFLSTYFKNL